MLDLELFLTDASRLVPVYLSPSGRTIFEANVSNSLSLPPTAFTINPPQPGNFPNRVAGCEGLLPLDFADNLKFHEFLNGGLTV
jgi:hypothetical protein